MVDVSCLLLWVCIVLLYSLCDCRVHGFPPCILEYLLCGLCKVEISASQPVVYANAAQFFKPTIVAGGTSNKI